MLFEGSADDVEDEIIEKSQTALREFLGPWFTSDSNFSYGLACVAVHLEENALACEYLQIALARLESIADCIPPAEIEKYRATIEKWR